MHFRVDALEQHYGSAQVLRGVSLEIRPGECLAVLGRNGAGKSTLMKCIAGLLPVTRGTILADGVDITAWPSHRRSRVGLAYVPQGREIFAELTVRENVEVSARAHGTLRDGAIDEALALFPGLKAIWARSGGTLSGGQQQQLAIARALVTRPKLLILDEPTEGIQPNVVSAIRDIIEALKTRISILLVEQYLDFAFSVADRYLVLSRGAVVDAGERETMSRQLLSHYIAV